MSYFLSKGGTKFGPFTAEQLEELKSKGEFLTYSFFWDDAKPGWQPIDMPPEAPTETASATARKAAHKPSLVHETRRYETGLKAVCIDHEHAMNATLSRVSDEGCELTAEKSHGANPQFVANTHAMLNLFDEKTGKSVNVPVQIAKVSRQDGVWKYRVQWDNCPELISAA